MDDGKGTIEIKENELFSENSVKEKHSKLDLMTNRGKPTPNESFSYFTSGRAYTSGKLNQVFGTNNSKTPPQMMLE